MRHTLYLICCLTLFLSALTPGFTAEAMTGALIIGKDLGFDQSSVIPLLEAQLDGEKSLQLLERTEIARLLKEQQLSGLLSPENGKDRVAMGKMLHADLLFLLQAVERPGADGKPVRGIEVVVSETRQGLRLLSASRPQTEDAEADAEALAGLLQRGLRKAQEPIAEICAVPPFISKDLTHTFDYQQAGYARLFERQLLDQPNVVVVEFAEAQAISKENAVTGGEVGRKLPLYFNGEFRNDGVGDKQRVAIKVALIRGTDQLGLAEKADMTPGDVGTFLLETASGLLGKAIGKPVPKHDAETEVNLLNAQAAQFKQIGNWQEALVLYDASLLLKPDQPDTLFAAARMVNHITELPLSPPRTKAGYLQFQTARLDAYWRTRQYLDAYVRLHPMPADPYYGPYEVGFYGVRRVVTEVTGYAANNTKDPAVQELVAVCRQIIKSERDRLFLTAEDELKAQKYIDSTTERALTETVTYHQKELGEPLRSLYTLKLRVLRVLARQEKPIGNVETDLFMSVSTGGLTQDDYDSPEYAAFLDRIAEIDKPFMPALIDKLRTLGDPARDPETGEAVPLTLQRPAVLPGELRLTRFELTLVNPEPDEAVSLKFINGWLPCGQDREALWQTDSLYLMTEKGKLKRLMRPPGNNTRFADAAFDGKYLWIPAMKFRDQGKPETWVVVVDPVSEQCWQFGVEDGLPPAFEAAAAGMAPGKLCLAGCTEEQSWIAVLTLGANGEKKVEIIHQAQVKADSNAQTLEAISDSKIIFSPSFLIRLPSAGEQLLLGRKMNNFIPGYPLLIDLQARRVEVVRQYIPNSPWQPAPTVHGGQLFYYQPPMREDIGDVVSLSLPDFSKTGYHRYLPPDCDQQGALFFLGDRLVFRDLRNREWLVADDLNARYRKYRNQMIQDSKKTGQVFQSQSCGLVYVETPNCYTVELTDPTVKE